MNAVLQPERLDLAGIDRRRFADVAQDYVITQRSRWQRDHRRPRAITAREALTALQVEAEFVYLVACHTRDGVPLLDRDLDRLAIACRRLDELTAEACG